jgi:hypothetical protein
VLVVLVVVAGLKSKLKSRLNWKLVWSHCTSPTTQLHLTLTSPACPTLPCLTFTSPLPLLPSTSRFGCVVVGISAKHFVCNSQSASHLHCASRLLFFELLFGLALPSSRALHRSPTYDPTSDSLHRSCSYDRESFEPASPYPALCRLIADRSNGDIGLRDINTVRHRRAISCFD